VKFPAASPNWVIAGVVAERTVATVVQMPFVNGSGCWEKRNVALVAAGNEHQTAVPKSL